jgi:hypothetical protein|tara:strand:+ start:968 stop:1192 length:225 start_codon:yes stop_codon:yes gene_type:complete
MKDKIYIDNSRFMELIDEIVTQITEAEFKEQTSKLAENGDWVLQGEAQDFYNEKYKEYENLFNNIANILSDARQ